jgi:uncharacterized membrane protein
MVRGHGKVHLETGRSAWIAWSILVLLAGSVMVLIVLPPLLARPGTGWLGQGLMLAYSPLCHQDPTRSLHLGGVSLLACTRCMALYAGGFLGLLLAPALGLVRSGRLLPRWVFVAGLLPLAVDSISIGLGLLPGTHASRAATGLVGGAVTALFLLPAMIEVLIDLHNRLIVVPCRGARLDSATEVRECPHE